MSLADELSKISEQPSIVQRPLMKTERGDTSKSPLSHLFEALGYNTHNLADVEAEYSADDKV